VVLHHSPRVHSYRDIIVGEEEVCGMEEEVYEFEEYDRTETVCYDDGN
jgi:hypothetical protein